MSPEAPGLAGERCQACRGEVAPLGEVEARELGGQLDPAWELGPTTLHRRFRLPGYNAAFGLAARVAMLAERQGHHPELHLGYGHLDVELTTHAAKGLTRNDFILAAKIDAIAAGPS